MNRLFEVSLGAPQALVGSTCRLQGACWQSAFWIHSALVLHKSNATGLGTKKKAFLAYFDAAKAFDSVWIQWLGVRRWFSPDAPVSSTTYNWVVMN